MSSNLDRSLDEILANRPRGGRRGRGGAAAASSGGIRKRPQRAAAQKANTNLAQSAPKSAGNKPKLNATKIIVSNLVSFILFHHVSSRKNTANMPNTAVRCYRSHDQGTFVRIRPVWGFPSERKNTYNTERERVNLRSVRIMACCYCTEHLRVSQPLLRPMGCMRSTLLAFMRGLEEATREDAVIL